MGAGGAAAAPYSRAANDECRICGGRFLVSNSLYDLTRHIFLSFSLCDAQQASVTGKKTLLLERGFLLALKRRKGVVVFTVLGARTTEAKARSIRFGFRIRSKIVSRRVKGKRHSAVSKARENAREIGRYRFECGGDATTTPRESRFDTFESDLRRLGRMPFW